MRQYHFCFSAMHHPAAADWAHRAELAGRIHTHLSDVFRVGVLGYGGPGSRKFGFQQYVIEGMSDWVIPTLPEVWEDFPGEERGIIFSIWDASRLLSPLPVLVADSRIARSDPQAGRGTRPPRCGLTPGSRLARRLADSARRAQGDVRDLGWGEQPHGRSPVARSPADAEAGTFLSGTGPRRATRPAGRASKRPYLPPWVWPES